GESRKRQGKSKESVRDGIRLVVITGGAPQVAEKVGEKGITRIFGMRVGAARIGEHGNERDEDKGDARGNDNVKGSSAPKSCPLEGTRLCCDKCFCHRVLSVENLQAAHLGRRHTKWH